MESKQVAVCLIWLVAVPMVVLGSSTEMQERDTDDSATPLIDGDELSCGGWDLVFQANAGNGHNVLQAWKTGYGVRTHPPADRKRSCKAHYRNSKVNNWEHLGVSLVRLTLFEHEQEVAFLLFDGHGSTSMNWFDKNRVIDSSWCDVSRHAHFNFFSVEGDPRYGRRFFINRNYGGCGNDRGNFVVSDTDSKGSCAFDTHPVYPQIVYSKISAAEKWNHKMYGRADSFTIHLKYK